MTNSNPVAVQPQLQSDVYVIPRPEDIIKHDDALDMIKEIKALPAAWVYVLTKVLTRPTPEAYIQKREGPNKTMLSYVDGAYAIATRASLSQLGIASDFEVLETNLDGENSVSALGKLTFKLYLDGVIYTTASTQWGECTKRTGMAWGDVRKGAATDALKKCMSEFGWAADVYGLGPEEGPPPPTAEEAHAKSVEYVIGAATEKGITSIELDAYVEKKWPGKKLTDLSQADLTSLRRKITSKEGLK